MLNLQKFVSRYGLYRARVALKDRYGFYFGDEVDSNEVFIANKNNEIKHLTNELDVLDYKYILE